YLWTQAVPDASAEARSALKGAVTGASVRFTPDVAGIYSVTCTVDGSTTYVLRIDVVALAVTRFADASRFPQRANATVPAPTTGSALFHSEEEGGLSVKTPGGTVTPLTTPGTVPVHASRHESGGVHWRGRGVGQRCRWILVYQARRLRSRGRRHNG
ncbi:MAG: hypothetical protein ACYTBJ_22420, partial [Planctomycetota bacterium]